MARARRDRKRAETRGRRAEQLAALWLQLKGYRILARRVRLSSGEIDLVARRGNLVAFVEVKQRASRLEAETAVRPSAWRRINRTAETWMASRSSLSGLDWRFDLVMIVPHHLPIHLRDTWRPDFASTGI
ncbi:YraN family protein [Henriciella aquimarina]|uniref:YraN family protein n=1 Tax=Henriciella aquimarina TaxID=545261 RepID=UPI000A04F8AD|nr:YraN family protein [Henriciella aquimarina]